MPHDPDRANLEIGKSLLDTSSTQGLAILRIAMVEEITLTAPPGKLGISWVRQPAGYTVVAVRDDSPLAGKLELGSTLQRIDDVDVTTLTKLTELIQALNADADKERLLVFKPPRQILAQVDENRAPPPTPAIVPAPPPPQPDAMGFLCCSIEEADSPDLYEAADSPEPP